MKRALVFAFCLLLSVAAAQATRVDVCGCGAADPVPMAFAIRHSETAAQQVAMEAFTAWNQYVDVFRPAVLGGESAPGNGVSEILFYDLSEIFGTDGASVLGFTPSKPDGAFGDFNECPVPAGTVCGAAITEADVLMNSTIPWQTSRPALGQGGSYYQATATHELGHALGFHHVWKNYSEMNYLPHFARYLSRADVLAARRQYPNRVRSVTDVATYPFTYNENGQTDDTDGVNAMALATFTPQTVAPGGKITIKNWTLENLSNTSPNIAFLFFLSRDQTITTSDVFLGGMQGPLSTWADDPDGTEVTVPANTPTGVYYVGAMVGLGSSLSNFVADGITSNNSWVLPTPVSIGSGSAPTVCTPSDTTLCLSNKRFSVTVNWAHAGTPGGVGHTKTLTDASGLFWFSSSDNIEMLVKVLDACGFNNRIWVFGAAATSLQYDLTVLDNHTGRTKLYHNDDNRAANAIIDTDAFATCGQ